MTPERLTPDTNAVIALFVGDEKIKDVFRRAPNVLVSTVVLGELFYGARHSNRVESNVARIDAFVAENTVLDCDLETARVFGLLKAGQRLKGRMIPDNDLWIAAIAIQHDLTLLTN